MFKYPKSAVITTSFCALLFVTLVPGNFSFEITTLLFLVFPPLLLWMVVSVLKNPMGMVPKLAEARNGATRTGPILRRPPEVLTGRVRTFNPDSYALKL